VIILQLKVTLDVVRGAVLRLVHWLIALLATKLFDTPSLLGLGSQRAFPAGSLLGVELHNFMQARGTFWSQNQRRCPLGACVTDELSCQVLDEILELWPVLLTHFRVGILGNNIGIVDCHLLMMGASTGFHLGATAESGWEARKSSAYRLVSVTIWSINSIEKNILK
jgi:hypothetical protein